MNVEIQIDASYIDPKVIIITAEVTEKVNGIVKKLSEDIPQLLSGIREGAVKILEKADIIRIYAEAGKTVAVTEDGEYTVRRRLYELEDQLTGDFFARISNSEIINLKKVDSFDLSLTGPFASSCQTGIQRMFQEGMFQRSKKF